MVPIMHTHTYTHIKRATHPLPPSSSSSCSCHQPSPPPNLTLSPYRQDTGPQTVFLVWMPPWQRTDEWRSDAHINKRGVCMKTSLVVHLRVTCSLLNKSLLNVKWKVFRIELFFLLHKNMKYLKNVSDVHIYFWGRTCTAPQFTKKMTRASLILWEL